VRLHVQLRGPVETHFVTSRWTETSSRAVPSTAAFVTARPCDLDGVMVTHRLHDPVKVRYRTHKALENSRYRRSNAHCKPRHFAG